MNMIFKIKEIHVHIFTSLDFLYSALHNKIVESIIVIYNLISRDRLSDLGCDC